MSSTTTPMRLDPSTGWTCVACKLVFSSGQLQRDHYRGEWHLYNMKRQIAGLPPVTERDFQEKLQHFSQHNQTATDGDTNHRPPSSFTIVAATAPFPCSAAAPPSAANIFESSLVCTVCRNKRFRSRNAFDNHMRSRRHKEAEEEAAAAADALSDGGDEEEEGEEVSSDNDAAVKEEGTEDKEDAIPPTECLFCDHKTDNLKANLEHMTMQHGFLIPDLPFCTDVMGLLTYLGFKIGVGRTCIRCRCARFRSLDALRKHMRDSNHCNFRIDTQKEGDVLLEFMDFYDYGTQCEEEEDEWESDDDGTAEHQQQQKVDAVLYDEGAFLVLPSGARIGHRSLVRYFRQRLGYGLGGGGGDWQSHQQRQLANAKKASIVKQLGGSTTASSCSTYPVTVLEASVKARARDVSFMKRTIGRYRLRRELASNKLFRSRGRDDQQ